MIKRYCSVFFCLLSAFLCMAWTVTGCSAADPVASSQDDTNTEATAPAPEATGSAEEAVTACGALRDVCCANNVCTDGLVCDATGGLCRVGVNCGSAGQACCVSGRCAANLNCTSNTCTACGATGEACCGAGTTSPCVSGDVCFGGTCAVCGGAGQPCCPGSLCNNENFTCSATTGRCVINCHGACCLPDCFPRSP